MALSEQEIDLLRCFKQFPRPEKDYAGLRGPGMLSDHLTVGLTVGEQTRYIPISAWSDYITAQSDALEASRHSFQEFTDYARAWLDENTDLDEIRVPTLAPAFPDVSSD